MGYTQQAVEGKRKTKREAIEDFFFKNMTKKFSSYQCHAQFGSAFRSRVSEINRDTESRVVICNEVDPQLDGAEHSTYYAVRRGVTPYLKNFMEETRA